MAFTSSSSSSTATYLLTAFSHHHDSNSSGGSGSVSNGGTNADSEDSQLSLLGQCPSQNQIQNGPPRQKINARERYRTFNVNSAYEALRSLIPTEPMNRKLSKIEIIRLASSYITHLSSTLQAGTDFQPCLKHQQQNESSDLAARIRIFESVLNMPPTIKCHLWLKKCNNLKATPGCPTSELTTTNCLHKLVSFYTQYPNI